MAVLTIWKVVAVRMCVQGGMGMRMVLVNCKLQLWWWLACWWCKLEGVYRGSRGTCSSMRALSRDVLLVPFLAVAVDDLHLGRVCARQAHHAG
jgi:hypothetical protein